MIGVTRAMNDRIFNKCKEKILKPRSGFTPFLIKVFLMFSCLTYFGLAQAELPKEVRESYLKGAFLRYAARLVQWPKEAIPGNEFTICVLGQVDYYKGLESIDNKSAEDYILKLKKIQSLSEANQNCQILYVTNTEKDNQDKIIKALRKKPILGFSDIEDFAKHGGAMNFYEVNNRLAIQVNTIALNESNLKINPRMLKLVTIVPDLHEKTVTGDSPRS